MVELIICYRCGCKVKKKLDGNYYCANCGIIEADEIEYESKKAGYIN